MRITKKKLLAGLTAAALLMAGPAGLTAGPPCMLAELYAACAEPWASGEAVWCFNESIHHPEASFTVEVEDIGSTDTVYVLLNGDLIGEICLTDGAGELVLDTVAGDEVPDVSPGDEVTIVDLDRTVLLRGVF
jgi:hypothetical protein